jgi:hypothetical protein
MAVNTPRWTYRANRAFGVIEPNEVITFDEDDDPVMVGLVGAGYIDLVSGPPGPGIPSKEKFGKPSIKQGPAPNKEKEEEDTDE